MDDTGEPIRFSTQHMDTSHSASVEEVYASITRMNIASATDAALDVEMSLRLLPGVSIASISTSPYRIERTHAQTIDGNDDFVLTVVRRAGIAAQQPGREAEFQAGEAYLWLNDRRMVAVAPQGARFLNIAVPCTLIAPVLSDIDAVLKDRLPNSMPLALLASYAEGLMADTPLSPEMAMMAGSHMRDLIIAALGAKPAAAVNGGPPGVRAARLDAVKRDVLENLHDPALSIDTMATRHRISPHYIRALFNSEGIAFTDYVREQRLREAFRRLSDPNSAHVGVGAIAFACGFSDLSWFNQAFKRRFGNTPSAVREHGSGSAWSGPPASSSEP
ncbi:MAG TPA: AraC family transcriptional regulator [Devosia sp.]|uniref:AraC family transcriptional regulator n=1 Tax=Devosia sp. TaxID=1871048 RepID=UPI002DDD084E|nr:AraC family transcriptional regulator [Devosia sp.]HEV2518920.1 AraC family transcriptional regulator [Devosia sp.]